MFERGMFSRAMKLARTGLQIAQATSSETRLLRADLLTTIGGAQLEGLFLEESYTSLNDALNLRLSACDSGLMDPTHPQIANSYMSLGTAAVCTGRVQEAIHLGQKSIELRRSREAEQVQMLAMSYHNVALAALCAGQLGMADQHVSRSIELAAKITASMTVEQQK